MAFINVLDWDAATVADWLIGLELDPHVAKNYSESFRNNNINGQRLMHLTVSDLIKLNVEKLGHQEVVLEGLEKLKNLHYNLTTENLQYVALKLSCKAQSLFNEISILESKADASKSTVTNSSASRQKVNTSTMSSVADVLDALMTMLIWLDKPPFLKPDLNSIYKTVNRSFVSLGIELATNAQRDTFAENPMDVIKKCCLKIADVCDQVITEVNDSLILEPASLDIVTAKRKHEDDDFGIVVDPCFPNGHLISQVEGQSGRVRPGDEIIQINYQTVVGWSLKKLNEEMTLGKSLDVVLTLKKMPKHLEGCSRAYYPSQIFPIPCKKRQPQSKVSHEPQYEEAKLSETSQEDDEDDIDDIDDDVYLPTTSLTKDISPTQSVRSLLMRPRSTPIRRATISAGSPSKHQPYINVSEIWAGIFDTSRSNNSDGNSSKPSSATSTMHSNDSGCATMYSLEPARPSSEYINVANEGYINLFNCKTQAGKHRREPPPIPSKQPVPKPRCTNEVRKKRPVPQPRSFASKSTGSLKSTAKLVSMTSEVHPIPSANVKIFKKFPASSSIVDVPMPSPPTAGKTSSSSSSEDEEAPPDLPPALPPKNHYVSEIVQQSDQK